MNNDLCDNVKKCPQDNYGCNKLGKCEPCGIFQIVSQEGEYKNQCVNNYIYMYIIGGAISFIIFIIFLITIIILM